LQAPDNSEVFEFNIDQSTCAMLVPMLEFAAMLSGNSSPFARRRDRISQLSPNVCALSPFGWTKPGRGIECTLAKGKEITVTVLDCTP
jgi:hypothetical protein